MLADSTIEEKNEHDEVIVGVLTSDGYYCKNHGITWAAGLRFKDPDEFRIHVDMFHRNPLFQRHALPPESSTSHWREP